LEKVTVIVDLRKKRRCDTQFDYMVETYGLAEAIETWTEWDKTDRFHQGLLDWRLSGMTYKAIGAMCNLSQQKVAAIVRPLKHDYDIRCDANKKKIEAILKREDPDYDYITNQRTVIQEMSALAMGGQEVLNILEQLSNYEKT
jgi:hypothetical protein